MSATAWMLAREAEVATTLDDLKAVLVATLDLLAEEGIA